MDFAPEEVKKMDSEVRAVGRLLGMEMVAPEKDRGWNYYARLRSGDRRLLFHTSDYKLRGRWQVTVEFPRDGKGQTAYNVDERAEITVSREKAPSRIAGDIRSRLLPKYEEALPKVLERIKRSDEYDEGRMRQMRLLADFLKIKRPLQEDESIFPPGRERGVYKISPYSQDKVKFEVEASAEKAIEVMKLLGY